MKRKMAAVKGRKAEGRERKQNGWTVFLEKNRRYRTGPGRFIKEALYAVEADFYLCIVCRGTCRCIWVYEI